MAVSTTDMLQAIEGHKNALKNARGVEKARIYEQMGDVYLAMEKAPKAVIFYRSAFEGGLDEPSFIDKYARSMGRSGSPADAIALAEGFLDKQTDNTQKARLNMAIAFIENWIGKHESARQHCEVALSLLAFSGANDRERKILMAEAYVLTGRAYWRDLRLDEALRFLTKSLDLFKHLKDQTGISEAFNTMGNVHYHQGDLKLALDCYERAHKAKERAGYYNNAGLIKLAEGKLDEAEDLFRTGLRKSIAMGQTFDIPQVQLNLADLYFERSDLIMARSWIEMAEKSMDELMNNRLAIDAKLRRGRLSFMEGDFDMASRLAEEALTWARKDKRPGQEGGSLRLQGVVAAGRGDLQAGRNLLQKSVEKFRKLDMHYEEACVMSHLAKVLLDMGDKVEARKTADQARKIFKGMGLEYELDKLKKLGL